MKKVLLAIVLIALLIVSCKTASPVRELPEFSPVIPTRPTLTVTEDDLTPRAADDIRALIVYATELEIYGAGWREFYTELAADVAAKAGEK